MARTKGGDFAAIARRVVEQAIGEHLDGTPLETKRSVPKRRIGGRKGGKARAAKLTPDKRADIARIAAEARWKKS